MTDRKTEYKGVSIIVPVYNAEDNLVSNIESVINSNFMGNKYELIYVNNSSTDTTLDILNRYRDKITILSEEKKGPAAARNRGLLNAKYEYIAFTDSDCEVDQNWIKNIVEPLKNNSVGIVGGKILSKRPCNKIEEYGEMIHDQQSAINKYVPPYAITMNWASRISVLKELGFFNEELVRGEDSDMSRRIYQAGYKLAYNPDAVVYHQNRKTLAALFYQGYLHGFYGIKLNKIHLNFLKQYGYKRVYFDTYKELFGNLKKYITDRNQLIPICHFIFNLGKKLGKIHGSVRFLHFEL